MLEFEAFTCVQSQDVCERKNNLQEKRDGLLTGEKGQFAGESEFLRLIMS